jgi:hypothetical protein
MDSPQTHIWGPNLWMILHSAAERIGSLHMRRLPNEESRIWGGLLASFRFSLPCPTCKKHYTDFFGSHPLPQIKREEIREWLYILHSNVNGRTEKLNTITIEQIPEIYSVPFNFTRHFTAVAQQMLQSIRVGWSARGDVERSLRFLQELKRFYDFF